MFRDGRDCEFPFEEIDLVEEEDDWFALEPLAIDEGLEQHHSFMHLVLPYVVSSRCWSINVRNVLSLPRSDLQPDIGRIQREQP